MNRSNKKQEFSNGHSICVEGDYKCVYSPDIMYGTMLQSLNPRSLGANPLLRCSPGFRGNWFISVSTLQKTTSSQQTPRQSTYRLHKTLRFVGFRFNHIQNNQRPKHLSCHCFWIQIPVSSWSIFLHSTANNSIHSDSHQPRILLSATRVCLRIGYSYPLVIENGDL